MNYKIRYALRNKHTGESYFKIYTLKQLEFKGLRHLFDLENYIILSRDRFTGLKDRNGREIYFESDIITCTDIYGRVVTGILHLDEEDLITEINGFVIDDENEKVEYSIPFMDIHTETLQNIGNIHDNPELLEKS